MEDNTKKKTKDLLSFMTDEYGRLKKEYIVIVGVLSVAIAFNILLKLLNK